MDGQGKHEEVGVEGTFAFARRNLNAELRGVAESSHRGSGGVPIARGVVDSHPHATMVCVALLDI